MDKTISEKVIKGYFVTVAVMMYYFLNEYIDLGIHITYRHAFTLVLAFSAMALFLYKPNVARGFSAFKSAFVYSIPLIVTTVVSLFIWFEGRVGTDVIARGLSSSFIYANMFSFALGAGAMLYVFGEKGIWYNLVAILIANILMIFTIIAEFGLGNYFSELVTLIATFADETGDIIIKAEIHELAFCLGAYLIYMLYKPKKNIVYFILLFLTLFCFLSAFRRIAMLAIVISLIFGYGVKFVARYSEKIAMWLLTFLSLLIIIALIYYIVLIKSDAFELLEKAGINTSGRVGIYNAVDEFYEFSPDFLGNGIGFLTYKLNSSMSIGVASIHNDFLQHFIDLGFWGYIIWLLSMILLRVRYFGAKGKIENAIITFMLVLYLIIASTTDNTMNYPLLTGVLALLMMGHGFNKTVSEKENKLFGYVSKENRDKDESLL